jgi:two-component system, NtrC family, nitrogen regulation sensor histidine kinase NtrY
MNRRRFRVILLISTIVLLLISLASESLYFSNFEYAYRTRLFNKTLIENERILDECLEGMKPILAKEDHHGSMPENTLFALAEENSITILEYLDNKLAFWSNNGFNVPAFLKDTTFSKKLVFLQNGWFLTRTIEAGNEKIIGLLRIRTDYGFKNDIITSGFEDSYKLPENVGLSTDPGASDFHVYDKSGQFIFSLLFPEVKEKTAYILIPLLSWTITFFLVIMLLLEIVKELVKRGRSGMSVILILLLFAAFYFIFLLTARPSVFFRTELFSPFRFSFNSYIPSLGHLLLLSILSAVFAGIFFRYFPFTEKVSSRGAKGKFILAGLVVGGALLISLYHFIFSKLISTSNINFETYKVLEMSAFTAVGFLALFLLMLVPVLFLLQVLRSFIRLKSREFFLLMLPSLFIPVFIYHNDPGIFIPLAIFIYVLAVIIWLTEKYGFGLFNMTLLFSLVFGIYSLYFITNLSEEKISENIKIQAVSLSSENDPEAEHLLLDLWPSITNDTVLTRKMNTSYFNKSDVDWISGYLQDNYFTGYWRNFSFRIFLCSYDQPIEIDQNNEMAENCFAFFDERIRRDGHQLTGTDFYFMENQGGRSYYLGRIFYKSGSAVTNGIFIELYSDINVFQPGYSALLLDKKYHGYAGLKDYSFAKYLNGEIVLRTGEYPYFKTDAEYVDKVMDYKIFRANSFKHVLYKSGNATVIISRPYLTTGDTVISFAYLFSFILLFSNLVVIVIRRPVVRNLNLFNFRQKLQLSFIGILLVSFILIGIVVAYLTISQYQSKHQENIKEKLNSIYLELDSKIGMEDHLSNDWAGGNFASLNDMLIKFSNIFNTDINLYDLNGYLISTSRPEIFYRDLISNRINNIALNNFRGLTMSEYYQKEKIGNLEYLSAYVPFFNTENKVLAYLNLPYFRMQSVIAKEISNLIVAVINFTLLLVVITMSIAVFISGRLTAPLSMLSEGLSSVELGKKSEHLKYGGNDEIGELVRQYNRMVDEIEESTVKLANSEREYAWREMARQIAHEIKNPLTPMKLNVQQLLKSWYDKIPDFGAKLEVFAKNQIEYIDNLSSIATAFSSFAKMPGNRPAELNLIDQLKITLELFKNTANIDFSIVWPRESRIIVFADKEHLNGVFSNLIKNGIQSVPAGRRGIIKVSMKVIGNNVLVEISDNGIGIPSDIQKKLFTPNFTTKSSGMGLGLSIVKKYIESANGRIWFESEHNKGTTFFVELPLKYTVEKPVGRST